MKFRQHAQKTGAGFVQHAQRKTLADWIVEVDGSLYRNFAIGISENAYIGLYVMTSTDLHRLIFKPETDSSGRKKCVKCVVLCTNRSYQIFNRGTMSPVVCDFVP